MAAMITSAQVKTELGITATTWDTEIASRIPIVEADIRDICNYSFRERVYCRIADGETVGNLFDLQRPVLIGTILEGTGITAGTTITDYDVRDGEITISAVTTAAITEVIFTISVNLIPYIAQMVWYRVSKMSVNAPGEKSIKSKRIGQVSVTYGDGEINKQYDYPERLISALPQYLSMG